MLLHTRPSLQWLLNNSPVSSLANYSIMIMSMTQAQGGVYQCKATNSRGTVFRNHSVSVIGKTACMAASICLPLCVWPYIIMYRIHLPSTLWLSCFTVFYKWFFVHTSLRNYKHSCRYDNLMVHWLRCVLSLYNYFLCVWAASYSLPPTLYKYTNRQWQFTDRQKCQHGCHNYCTWKQITSSRSAIHLAISTQLCSQCGSGDLAVRNGVVSAINTGTIDL